MLQTPSKEASYWDLVCWNALKNMVEWCLLIVSCSYTILTRKTILKAQNYYKFLVLGLSFRELPQQGQTKKQRTHTITLSSSGKVWCRISPLQTLSVCSVQKGPGPDVTTSTSTSTHLSTLPMTNIFVSWGGFVQKVTLFLLAFFEHWGAPLWWRREWGRTVAWDQILV